MAAFTLSLCTPVVDSSLMSLLLAAMRVYLISLAISSYRYCLKAEALQSTLITLIVICLMPSRLMS